MANLRVDKITSTETFEKTGSVQFDGSGDYLSIPDSTDFTMGTGDYTIEGWFYFNATGTNRLFGQRNSSAGESQFLGEFFDGHTITYYHSIGGTNYAVTKTNIISLQTWYHIAITRHNQILHLYVNGVLQDTNTTTGSLDDRAQPFVIGRQGNFTSNTVNGHISNFRIIKGQALYTSNFKPPMRELEVVPGTVLLACQSKTDASLEKTGKTITVTGNAVACELTPGILTPIVKSGGGSAITGSVEFDGTGDYLSVQSSTDFDFGTGDFTIELYANLGNLTNRNIFARNDSNPSNTGILLWQNGSGQLEWQSSVGDSTGVITVTTPLTLHEWAHIAVSRKSNTTRLFANGVLIGSTSDNTDISGDSVLNIGSTFAGTLYYVKGFISNFRINKGTALYTNDFIPPTRELKNVPGTVLLCCQDENSATTEVTGKTITSNGDPAASNFTPQVGDDRQVTFEGVTKINSDAYFYLPTGDTASRTLNVATQASSSARGINGGGYIAPNNTNTMQYITIATTGNGADFGDLTAIRNTPGAVASSTRGIWMGGIGPSPSNTALDVIDYVTIASTGNAADFGDLINNHRADSAAGNSTRGLRLGQQQSPAVGNTIEYITIASTGDAKDFGDLVQGRSQSGAFASPTRAVQIGGYGGPSTGNVNTIDYVTIQTMGNSIEFGDLKDGIRTGARGCSNATRGVFGGGYNPTPYASDLDYVTIASTGNSQDFGNLSMGNRYGSSCSSLTRGIFFIGESTSPTPGQRQDIDYVTLATLANANDFGDLISSYSGYIAAACSSGHGGLG